MKKVCLFFLFSIPVLVRAQQLSIKWSDKFALTSGIFTNNTYQYSLPASNETIISVFRKVKTAGLANDYILARFNTKPDIVHHAELNFADNEKEGLVELIKLKGIFYLIKYRRDGRESLDVYAVKLNEERLTAEGPEKKLGSFDMSDIKMGGFTLGAGRVMEFELNMVYSPDSSKFALLFEPEQKRKEAKKAQVIQLNDKLDKVYAKAYEWSDPFNKLSIRNLSVDNEGRVYLLCNSYEDDFELELLRSDGDKVPPFTSHLVVFDEKRGARISLNTGGKSIHNAGLAYGKDQQLMLYGTLKDKHNGRLTGVFSAPVTNNAGTLAVGRFSSTPFPPDLLSLIDKDGQGKSSGKNPGLDNNFNTSHIISTSLGTVHLVTEYFDIDTKGPQNEFIKFTKGDLIVTTFSPEGNPYFQRIPRFQQTPNAVSSPNIGQAGSFTPSYYKGGLTLFYNDGEDNVLQDINEKPEKFNLEKNSALVAAFFNQTGALTKRKIAYSHSGMDGYVTNLRFTELNQHTYIVFAQKTGIIKHGMKVGVLTLK